MHRTRSGSAEFPQPKETDQTKMIDSDEVLFALVPETDPKPIVSIVSPENIPEPRQSEAWDDIGHRGPFKAPIDEDQVFAVEGQTPNPTTRRAIRQILTNRRFNLHGKVERTPDQDENAHEESVSGHVDREARDIENGMSPNEARARRIVRSIRRGWKI